jgi:hypothetical protein
MNKTNKTINKILIVGGLVVSLAACGGSGSSPASVVAPTVVVSVGLTLEEVVEKFNVSGGLNLTQNVSGNVSYGSGNDVAAKDFSFSVENSNGSKACVNYAGQDDSSIVAESFKFNSLDCDSELAVGGKADFDAALGDFINYSASAVVNSPVSGSYDIYGGSEDVSFKISNRDVLSCIDSVTDGSDYIVTGKDELGNTTLSVSAGIYADENFAGQEFGVSCDVSGVNGDIIRFDDVASFTASYSSVSPDDLVDRVAAESNSTVVDRNSGVCTGLLDNGYKTLACVITGSDGDVHSATDNTVSDLGIDYIVSGVNYTNASDAASGLVSRLGTPVLSEVKNHLADNLYQDSEPMTFGVKNVENYDSICELQSIHTDLQGVKFNALVDLELDENKFSVYNVEQWKEDFNKEIDPKYLDNNGDYNLGTFNCTFYSPNLNKDITINNVLSISGNINDNP